MFAGVIHEKLILSKFIFALMRMHDSVQKLGALLHMVWKMCIQNVAYSLAA